MPAHYKPLPAPTPYRAPALSRRRPKLTAETVAEYLDWITENLEVLRNDLPHHFTAAELVIRTRATDAQAKATHATLVEDGTIAPAR